MRPIEMTKVLVSQDPEKQDEKNYNFCNPDEILMWPFLETSETANCWVGIDSRKGCTQARVVELDLSKDRLSHLIKQSYSDAGFAPFYDGYKEFIQETEKEAARILKTAARFKPGTILIRTGADGQVVKKDPDIPPKCKNCDMPKKYKRQNTSIHDNVGSCSFCYMAKERDTAHV